MGLVKKLQVEEKIAAAPPSYGESHDVRVNMNNAQIINNVTHTSIFNDIRNKLTKCYNDNGLSVYYSQAQLEQIINRAQSINIERLKSLIKLESDDLVTDIYQLIFYDVAILCDDSGSMNFNGGECIEDLKFVVGVIASVVTLFDEDGISIRFLNNSIELDNQTDSNVVENSINGVKFYGGTPLGSALRRKIVQPFVLDRISSRSFTKPLMVIILTDGVADDNPQVEQCLADAKKALYTNNLGKGCVFQFAQLGKDLSAQKFLEQIDNNGGGSGINALNKFKNKLGSVFGSSKASGSSPVSSRYGEMASAGYGDIVDCTSGYDLESADVQKKHGIHLTPYMWNIKLLLGAIDAEYDGLDEA